LLPEKDAGALAPSLRRRTRRVEEPAPVAPPTLEPEKVPVFARGPVSALLTQAGVRPVAEKRTKGPQPLAGQIVLFTGTLEQMTRPEAAKKAEDAGARVASGISRKVTLVVAGPGAGSKLDEAKKLGLSIVDEAGFLKRIGEA